MAAGSAAVYSLGCEGLREYAGLGQPSLWPSNARGGGAVELVKGPKTLTRLFGVCAPAMARKQCRVSMVKIAPCSWIS